MELVLNGGVGVIGEAEAALLFTQPDHLPGQGHASLAALAPDLAESHVDAQSPAPVLHQLELGLGVGGEAVDGHHARQAKDVGNVAHVLKQVGQAFFQGLQVFLIQVGLGRAAVVLEGADGGHHHHGGGGEPGQAALDIQKLFRPQVGAEAGLGDGVVPQTHGHAGGDDAVAAVGDVGKGPAVDEGGGALQGLDQIGLHGVLEQGGHGALGLQVGGGHGLVVVGVGHHHPAQPGLQVHQVGGQAEHGHDLTGHGDVEAVLPGHAVHPPAQTVHHIAQLPVVHVHTAPPGDLFYVDTQGVALLDVVVQQGGQQVVGGADGVEVAGEVEVDVLHGHHLGIAAAGGAALDAEHGAQRGLPQGHQGVFPNAPQAVGQTHRGGGLALAGRGGIDGGHQDQLAVGPPALPQEAGVDLGLVVAVELQVRLVHARPGGDGADVLHPVLLRDLNVAFEPHAFSS